MENIKTIRENLINKGWLNVFQWVAMISMTIDHWSKTIGFGTMSQWLSDSIGNFGFIIFSFLVVLNINTSEKPLKYLKTLAILAAISQIPFLLVFDPASVAINNFFSWYFNVIVTLFLGASFIYLINKRSFVLAIIPIAVCLLIRNDYGINGILLMITFHLVLILLNNENYKELKIFMIAYLSLIVSVIMGLQYFLISQSLAIMFNLIIYSVIVLTLLFSEKLKDLTIIPKVNKAFRQFFYPIHFVVIYILLIYILN